MYLHTPTLLVVSIAITVTLSLCLGTVASQPHRDGLRYWAGALATHSAAYILLGLRGQISDLASIVLANTLLTATLALFTEGLYQFQQRDAPRWLIWSPVVLITGVFGLLLQQPEVRIVLNALLLIVQSGWILRLLAQKEHDTVGRGQYFVALGFTLVIAALLYRAAGTLAGGVEMASITASNHVQAITFLFVTVTVVMICLGLVLMTKERADERNRALAMQDELTGLSNRRFVLQTLTQQLALAQRSGQALSLLMIDIDHFKRVNDTFGHLSGDKVLRDLTARLRNRLRAQDIAGRFGGEEFLVILPDTDARGAHQLAEQLRRSVEATPFEAVDGRAMPLTISIGLHAQNLAVQESSDDLIGASDQALYLAKQNGRNRIEQR